MPNRQKLFECRQGMSCLFCWYENMIVIIGSYYICTYTFEANFEATAAVKPTASRLECTVKVICLKVLSNDKPALLAAFWLKLRLNLHFLETLLTGLVRDNQKHHLNCTKHELFIHEFGAH